MTDEKQDTTLYRITSNPTVSLHHAVSESSTHNQLSFLHQDTVILGKSISSKNASDFQHMADQVGAQLPLNRIVNAEGNFLIGTTLRSKAKQLGIEKAVADNWYTIFDLPTLASYVTKLFGQRLSNTSLVDQLPKFRIDFSSPGMHILNVQGEEHMLSSINDMCLQ